jgi:hypothetical protein
VASNERVLLDAPCLLYEGNPKHTTIVTWSQHVPCIAAALVDAIPDGWAKVDGEWLQLPEPVVWDLRDRRDNG